MALASNPTNTGATIDAAEAAHFGALAEDWWNPKGSSAMLHRLNPPRLRYIRRMIDQHWDSAESELRPLAGRSVLDMGCGAGLLSEPLARLGGGVTGVDAAPENVGAARAHADRVGLAIDYVAGDVGSVAGRRFDLITSMEVIEHVTNPAAFVSGLAALLAPGGLMILSTPNRTAMSRLALIVLGEGSGAIPRGTHDHDKFLAPDELAALVAQAGLREIDRRGLGFTPTRGFQLSEDLSIDYFLTAVHA